MGQSGSARHQRTGVGVDCGATLIKLALRAPSGELSFQLFPANERAAVVAAIAQADPERLGLTGAGASALAQELLSQALEPTRVSEFDAWTVGGAELLQRGGEAQAERLLLASVGTGTSALLLDGENSARVGGTALGGGTILGLGMALVGCADFAELCQLAQRGERSVVDIRVADIYPPGEIALAGEVTVASFGKLGLASVDSVARPEDLAAGIMGLVGENLALICCGLAAAADTDCIVYAGTTLRANPVLVSTLQLVTAAGGRRSIVPSQGEFAGALGALTLALGG